MEQSSRVENWVSPRDDNYTLCTVMQDANPIPLDGVLINSVSRSHTATKVKTPVFYCVHPI